MKKIKYSNKDLSKLIAYPDKDCNKYSRGTCYVVAGSQKYPGAAILASEACQKIGCGYTKLFTFPDNVLPVSCTLPSIPVDSFDNLEIRNSTKNRPLSYVIGPGFDPYGSTNLDKLLYLLLNTNAPVVIDGGALSLLANKNVITALGKRFKNGYKTILTPHYGEAKNLYFSCIGLKLPKDNFFVEALSVYFSSTVILKGPDTYICDSNKKYKMTCGTPALAKAGSGDVLAGFIGGLLSQEKISEFDACALAINLHALSGSLASKVLTNVCTNPIDLIKFLPKAILKLQ